jgi:hypothetical protein
MAKITGCETEWPDKLYANIIVQHIYANPQTCIDTVLALQWDGSKWFGDSGGVIWASVTPYGPPDVLSLPIDVDYGISDGDCSAGGHERVYESCNLQDFVPFWYGEGASPECCGRTDSGAHSEITITATPVGGGTPIPTTPPCVSTTPSDCCPTPGGGGPGGGPSGGGGPPGGGGPRKSAGSVRRWFPFPFGPKGGNGGPFGGKEEKCCPTSDRDGGGSDCGCSPPWSSSFPIRYATGELALSDVDLAGDGFGVPWGHTRSFASRLSISESLGNGYNWQVEEWPYLVRHYDGTVTVMGRANTAFWFDASGEGFVGRFGTKQSLIHDDAAEVYRFVNLDGSYIEFDDFTGMFQRHVDAAGNKVEVTAMHANAYNFTEVQRTYTSGGTTTTEQYFYEYTTSGGNDVLQRVTLRRKVDAGSWSNVSRATYTYYDGEDDHGGWTDLRTVITQVWEDSAWHDTGTTMYRYYKQLSGTSSSSSSSSSAQELPVRLLKYVVNSASYQRLADDPAVSDPLTASDFQVSQYADNYFEYDSESRVTKEIVQSGSRTFTFSYTESSFSCEPTTGSSSSSGGSELDPYNCWKYKTIETLPGGAQNIVYSNYAGQTMLHIFKDGDDEWLEFWKYDSNARAILHAKPSAISGYDDTKADLLNESGGSYQYLRDNTGLIEVFEYDSVNGYLTAEKVKKGETGTEIKLREHEYTSCIVSSVGESSSSSSSSGASSSPRAYFTSKDIVYPDASDQTKKLTTGYSYTFHAGTCQVKQKTTTHPVVSSSQNGSGIAATSKEVFDVYGNLEWVMDERGFITHMEYDTVTGAITKLIQDVDTSQVTDEPSGWETPTGGGLHTVTDFEHDDLGRMTQSLGPAHTVDIDGTATSVRRATWTVYHDAGVAGSGLPTVAQAQGYATGASWDTFTLVNPVSITKFDENGLVQEEIAATRANTSGKLSASDTFAQSSYVRWTTHQYTDCCFLASTRTYCAIPTSGDGVEGTNYDQVNIGYDTSKRQNRQVTGGGTITRTVFDSRSMPSSIYVGTDDTGATAGDPTGGGATGNNMVIVTAYEYDSGADGGDGLLTKETQHVD